MARLVFSTTIKKGKLPELVAVGSVFIKCQQDAGKKCVLLSMSLCFHKNSMIAKSTKPILRLSLNEQQRDMYMKKQLISTWIERRKTPSISDSYKVIVFT